MPNFGEYCLLLGNHSIAQHMRGSEKSCNKEMNLVSLSLIVSQTYSTARLCVTSLTKALSNRVMLFIHLIPPPLSSPLYGMVFNLKTCICKDTLNSDC